MKIIDVDALFDAYIGEFVVKNIKVLKPEEIEDKIAELYVKFGDEKLKELDGKTPNTFYRDCSGKELIKALTEHVEKSVPVSDFLCEAIIEKAEASDDLVNLLDGDNDELKAYAINLIGDMKVKKPLKKYVELLFDGAESETVKELFIENLKENVNEVKDEILEIYPSLEGEEKLYALEILSSVNKDDRVFSLLIREFLTGENLLILTAYLLRYGDERALNYLMEKIEDKNVNYQEFKELKAAIEGLGGEYEKERDFSGDKIYKKIKEQAEKDKKIKFES